MLTNAERMYENLNGKEVGEAAEQLLAKLAVMVGNCPTLQQHLAWPLVKITAELTVEGEAMTPLKLSTSEGPAYAPDRFRAIFGLGIPVAVKIGAEKKATTTAGKSAKGAKTPKSSEEVSGE